MFLISLLLIPVVAIIIIFAYSSYESRTNILFIKNMALTGSIINLIVSLVIFIVFDFSSNQYQFVQEYHEVSYFDFYLGLDGLSIYFVLLTTIITPIALLSN
jgi:NADH:ubiquinone oxidoreductase subunit 4 (subunit M)